MLFLNMGSAEAARSLQVIAQLRRAGIASELYPDSAKMKKQMGYADAKAIPYVAIIGESELADGTVTLKNMLTGEQVSLSVEEVIARLK